MPFARYCIVVALLLVLPFSPAMAGGFQINEHGARAMGMGGAFVAQASDLSAMYYNPAGLGYMKGFKASIGTTLIAPTSSWTPPSGATTIDMVSQTFFPSNAYATYGLDNGLTFGAGVFTAYGLGTEWPVPWAGDTLAVDANLQSFYITPTIAYKISDEFSIGVSASYIITDVKLRYKVPTIVTPGVPPVLGKGEATLDADGTGFTFGGGILYRPTPALSIGVSYRHSAEIDYEGTATFKDMAFLSNAFGVNLFPGGDGKTTITLPSNLVAGIAYDITKDLTVEADFQWVGWSSYDVLNVTIEDGPPPPAPLQPILGTSPLQTSQTNKKEWEDTYLIRFGGEYRFETMDVRLGFIYDNSPQPDATLEPLLPDANRIEFTAGLGYKFTENFRADLAYQLILFSDRTVTAAQNSEVGFPGTYKSTANLFGLNLSFGI